VNIGLLKAGGCYLYESGLFAKLLNHILNYLYVKGTAVTHSTLDTAAKACHHMLQWTHIWDVSLNTFGGEGLWIDLFFAGSLLLGYVSMY
jgi:hypothetical protein